MRSPDELSEAPSSPGDDSICELSLDERDPRDDDSAGASLAEVNDGGASRAEPEVLDTRRFEVTRLIGAGGMGRVELVHDRRLLRDVAWKRGDARLLREARVLAQLEHPGIVPVHDMGFGRDGEAFFAMRVVRGRSLAEVLRDADNEQRSALVRSLQRAAEAVAYAHHRGVVHRDLKPANIMIGDFGEAQVVDWGLATVLGDAADPIPESARRALAGFEAGRVGTPGYMSPEQERGLAVDRRSDVFGLGKILERIFTPGPSQPRSSPSRAQPASPSDASSRGGRRADKRLQSARLNPELFAIIARATAPDPASRYPDARAFAADLARFLDGGRVAAYSYRPGELFRRFVSAYRVPLTVAVIGLVLALVLIAVYVVDVGNERAIAQSAEAATRKALVRSDRMLARALVGEARRLAQAGARPEAEVLAAHALALAEDPDARGIVSALGASSLRLVTRLDSPCLDAEVDPLNHRLLCVAADGVTLYGLEERDGGLRLLPRWTRHLPVQIARLTTGGVALASAREAVALDLEGREVLRQRSPINFTRKTSVNGDRVLFESAGVSAMVDMSTYELKALRGCPGSYHSAVVLAARGHALDASICKSGALRLWEDLGDQLTPSEANATLVDQTVERDEAGILSPIPTPFAAPEREAVRMVAYGRRFVVGTIKGEVAVLDPSGRVQASHTLVDGMVRVLAVSPDERYVAVAGEGDPIQIATLPDLAQVTALPRRARNATWDPSRPGELVTTGAFIERWRLDEPEPARPLSGAHNLALRDGVVSLEVDSAHDDRLAIAFGSYGGLVSRGRLVEVETGLVAAKGATLEGDLLTVAGVLGGVSYAVSELGAGATEALALTPFGTFPRVAVRRLVTLADGVALVGGFSWIGRFPASRRQQTVDEREAIDLAASPGRRFAVYVRQADHMLVRLRAGEPIGEEIGVDLDTEAVAISADGERIFSAHPDEVVVWTSLGQLEAVHRATDRNLTKVAVSGDGRYVAAGSREGTVLLWRVGEVEPVARFSDHNERVPALVFANDSRWLASGSWDRSLRFRDLARVETSPDALVRAVEQRYGMDLSEALGGARVGVTPSE